MPKFPAGGALVGYILYRGRVGRPHKISLLHENTQKLRPLMGHAVPFPVFQSPFRFAAVQSIRLPRSMLSKSVAYDAFRDELNALKPGWVMGEECLEGPEGAVVRLGQHHESESDGHVDILFELDGASRVRSTLWDCVCGFGATPAEKARSAAHLWAQTTAGALLELKYSRRGEFADHFRGNPETR